MNKQSGLAGVYLPLSGKAKCAPYPQVLKRTVGTIDWYVVTILPIADLVLLSCEIRAFICKRPRFNENHRIEKSKVGKDSANYQ